MINTVNGTLAACLLFTIVLFTPGSVTAQNTAHPEAELLSLHQKDRRAHFDHDVETLISHVAPVLLDVRDGQINRMSREDVRRRFVEYFKHAQFSAWDDVVPPIVRVSPDGNIGWMIVRVRIVYDEIDASGKKTNNVSVLAWMSAYEKQNGQWIMTAVTSTVSPGADR